MDVLLDELFMKTLAENRGRLRDAYNSGDLVVITTENEKFKRQAEILTKLLPTIIPFDKFMEIGIHGVKPYLTEMLT